MDLNERYLIIHADDAGLSQSENKATITCLENGMVNSYSIMVPCSGFEEIALFAKTHPDYDSGIHLTLTCEWHAERFGPVLPVSEVPSLVDENGHFHKTREALRKHGKAKEVYAELKAQIEKGLDFGITPTHLDSHMFSLGSTPEFFEVYQKLGDEYNLPILINPSLMEMVGLPYKKYIRKEDFILEHAHFATFDHFQRGHLKDFYLKAIEHLPLGLNILLIHPAYDNEEMQRITIDHPNFGSAWRQMDLESFTDEEMQKKLLEKGVKLISWKEISERFIP